MYFIDQFTFVNRQEKPSTFYHCIKSKVKIGSLLDTHKDSDLLDGPTNIIIMLIFLLQLLLHATILYVSLRYRNRGKRGRKPSGTRVQDAREYHECGKRTLYETPLYTRRCIRIRVMCTTVYDTIFRASLQSSASTKSRQT